MRRLLSVVIAIALLCCCLSTVVECRLVKHNNIGDAQSNVLDAAAVSIPSSDHALTQTHAAATNTLPYADEKQDRLYPHQLLTHVLYQVPVGHVLWHAVVESANTPEAAAADNKKNFWRTPTDIHFDPATATSFSGDPSEQLRLGIARELGRRKREGDKAPYTAIRVVKCVVTRAFDLYQLSHQRANNGYESNPFLSVYDPRYKPFCKKEERNKEVSSGEYGFTGFRDPDHRDDFAICPGIARSFISCDAQQGWTCPAEQWSTKISFNHKRSISTSIKMLLSKKEDKPYYLYSQNRGENYYIFPKDANSGDNPFQGVNNDKSGTLLDNPEYCKYNGLPKVTYANIMLFWASDGIWHKPQAEIAAEAEAVQHTAALNRALDLRSLIRHLELPIYWPEDNLDWDETYQRSRSEQLITLTALQNDLQREYPQATLKEWKRLSREQFKKMVKDYESRYNAYIMSYGRNGKQIWTRAMRESQQVHDYNERIKAKDPLWETNYDTQEKFLTYDKTKYLKDPLQKRHRDTESKSQPGLEEPRTTITSKPTPIPAPPTVTNTPTPSSSPSPSSSRSSSSSQTPLATPRGF